MKNKFIFSCLKALAYLPLPLLYILSDFSYIVIYHLVGYRIKVVRQNLYEAFPDKTRRELKKIERGFYHFLSDQLIETIKLLHISDKELNRRVKVLNYEEVNKSLESGKSAVVLLGHYGNWEWVQEISRYFSPSAIHASIYHRLKNKFWNEVMLKIRSRWGALMVPMEKATRVFLNKQNQPWVCGFIADARTDNRHKENCVRFLNHDTWFITGPEVIGSRVDADFFYLDFKKIKRGYYEISLSPLKPSDFQISFPYMREFWEKFQNTILRDPSLWLWSHKRWK